ncbi:MAG: glutamate synthase large subunit [Bacteroidales bacterium]|nr:glutamate synthase large subunit [Bacteroidales bacterium]
MNLIRPGSRGLYRPEFEKENCGIGFVAQMKGRKSHDIIQMGLEVLVNMAHRGAEGADAKTGDGAGILLQVPRDFYLIQGYNVPPEGQFGTGIIFLPQAKKEAGECLRIFENIIQEEGVEIIGYRDIPRDPDVLGEISRAAEPGMTQIFLGAEMEQLDFERRLYVIRKRTEKQILQSGLNQKELFYISSLSTRVLIYKGMLTSEQLMGYYKDLSDSRLKSAIGLIHSRFSTNTFPSWDLAQPFRLLAHNGEINTVKGNRFWMKARESLLHSHYLGDDLEKIFPIIEPGKSDSASLDNVLEFMYLTGKSLAHAVSILIPESWNTKNPISDDLRAFYEYHSTFLEPWDGPASLIFSDGRYIGGTLDRNGLRPSRYLITDSDIIVMGSEAGVQTFPAKSIVEKGRLHPGKMMVIDTKTGKIAYDPELKEGLSKHNPYKEWLMENRINLTDIETGRKISPDIGPDYKYFLHAFGYSKEDIELILSPMAEHGQEPVGSMGNDAPLAVLSDKPQRLFNYFKQLFAQVTNPAIDPIREELVMSLTGYIGSFQQNLLNEGPDHCKMVKLNVPVVSNTYFQVIKNLRYKGFSTVVLPILFPVKEGTKGLEKAVKKLCRDAEQAVDDGKNYIILSDRGMTKDLVPVPSLLAVSAVHHHLINVRKRMQIDIVLESAEPREVHHFALLFGYGASVINPYLAFAVIEQLVKEKALQLDYQRAEENYMKAIHKGLQKILSKMGISTLRSYRAAQIFEAVGIHPDVVNTYFEGTTSRIGGIGIQDIALEAMMPHQEAYETAGEDRIVLSQGTYYYRINGEQHAWNPDTIRLLQKAVKYNDYNTYKEFSRIVLEHNEKPAFLRGFFRIKKNPVPVEEVEPAESIYKRFVTGAMSYGSISREAHEALAVAMNTIGGRSNTGEGGEDPDRFIPRSDGTSSRSSIKQIASGRFGVTNHYLVNADEIQIKIAQGAKPGEGGQLPGHKVDNIIAKTRYSIPGITLISPPPHHDIYSIEDLSQLIFDLKNVNPKARVSVKLVSATGVGTIAAGVAKAGADIITISGGEGGTGASPSSSIKHAGLPMEIGLADTQQTLVMNNLRKKVMLQTDGQMKIGYDVVMAALLGAEEYGFATSALITMGCIMMRKCHLNTCPVGVATQDKSLRERFSGKSEYLINYFSFIAFEIREILAEMGYTKLDDIIGRTDLINVNKNIDHWKASKVDVSSILYYPEENGKFDRKFTTPQVPKLEGVIDQELIELCQPALVEKKKVKLEREIRNTDRAVGTMLSGRITEKYGLDGLPENTIDLTFKGSAGQSFGAFLVKGVTLRLEGDANDYLGKGLSGGKIAVTPPEGSAFEPDKNIIAGNTLLYGATSGEVYIQGMSGERFCVRNSGAIAVVEGAGDHCCEYMTGGRTVVLGPTGRNFAAGMSGGIAYVLNELRNFDYYCNMGMVELSLVEDLADIRELKDLITKHFKYTGSAKAKKILDSWEEYLTQFIKVIPFEYKAVMEEEKLKELRKKIEQVETDVENLQ